jgi:ribosomal protein L11 methyltransferase
MREWLELSIVVPGEATDAVTHRLIELGAPGVIEEEVGGAAGRVRLRAHFASAVDAAELRRTIREFLRGLEEIFPGCEAVRLGLERVREEDWAEGWKQGFPPLEVGERLRVRIPWSPPVEDGRLDVEILPAMAFGTGHHASTLGCLLALEALAGEGRVRSLVLDVGTGSGILAIAAARLGAEHVLAIDNDPAAVEAAAANVTRNRLEERVMVREATLFDVDGRFTLLLANLQADLLCALVGPLRDRARPDARLVTAGLLDEDGPRVREAAKAAGWKEVSSSSIDGWTMLLFARGESCRDSS